MRKAIDFLHDFLFILSLMCKCIIFIPFICVVIVFAIIVGLIFSVTILSILMLKFTTYMIKYVLKALNSLKKKSES